MCGPDKTDNRPIKADATNLAAVKSVALDAGHTSRNLQSVIRATAAIFFFTGLAHN